MRTSNYLVIDELGKLELKNKGLHESAKVLIPIYETQKNAHLILVIRDTLLNLVITHYNISHYHIT